MKRIDFKPATTLREPTELVAHGLVAVEDLAQLRAFLMERMYRHWKVNRTRSQARRILAEMFQLFMAEPDVLHLLDVVEDLHVKLEPPAVDLDQLGFGPHHFPDRRGRHVTDRDRDADLALARFQMRRCELLRGHFGE